jgi:hypothetical protein
MEPRHYIPSPYDCFFDVVKFSFSWMLALLHKLLKPQEGRGMLLASPIIIENNP